jgi:hypothetical protein
MSESAHWGTQDKDARDSSNSSNSGNEDALPGRIVHSLLEKGDFNKKIVNGQIVKYEGAENQLD